MTRAVRRVAVLVGACLALALAASCGPAAQATGKPNRGPVWNMVAYVGQSGGYRAAVYDRSRNCLWIVGLQRGASAIDPDLVNLTRVNVADRSVLATPVKLPATDFDQGAVAVDAGGTVWMGWGETLANYDPATGAIKSWQRPAYNGLARLYSTDGRMAAMTIDQSGEIWYVASMVSGIFGFNPATRTWDRTINLPFVASGLTVLAAPKAGLLTLNGAPLDPQSARVFGVVDTDTRVVRMLNAHPHSYVVISSAEVVYLDEAGTLATLNLDDGSSTVLATKAPVVWGAPTILNVDGKGNLWFGTYGVRLLGVGMLNVSNGAVSQYPFPYITNPGSPVPNDCPPKSFDCIPSGSIVDPGIQGVIPDQRGNVWVVTESPGVIQSDGPAPFHDPPTNTPMTAVAELQIS